MHRLVISAPFGNYVQPSGATATLGTYTWSPRPGRTWRILKTVRYYPRLRAWVNRIGLRNPGIDWLGAKVANGKVEVRDKLLSIHGFDADEWYGLLEKGAGLQPRALELNLSCPNVGAIDWPADLFSRAVATGVPVIAKLPPVQFELMFEHALAGGIRRFHCCNTLPVDAGGLSGRPLKPVALQCIRRLRELAGEGWDELRLIGGGGIREVADVDDYAEAGVHSIAVGTKVFNPRYLFGAGPLQPIRQRAEELLRTRPPVVEDEASPQSPSIPRAAAP